MNISDFYNTYNIYLYIIYTYVYVYKHQINIFLKEVIICIEIIYLIFFLNDFKPRSRFSKIANNQRFFTLTWQPPIEKMYNLSDKMYFEQ